MMEYIVKQKELRTEDVSRISYQLLDALDHCEKHGVIHRDLKPENTMFRHSMEGASLRVIDFGSSCIASETEGDENKPAIVDDNGIPLIQHSTFAGSAFYISPELFQRTYTYKTDIWSAGVTLYVLVAGFPAEKLQKAFNTLHMNKDRNIRSLPGLDNEGMS
jgi:serine/threonine protein kinase